MRLHHRAFAWLFGYFWKPCPVCGRMFGGHEHGGGQLLISPGRSQGTCPRCPHDYAYFHGALVRIGGYLRDDGRLDHVLEMVNVKPSDPDA